MSTIHNPVNFKPENYKVIGYFDNRPPEFFLPPIGLSYHTWSEMVKRERENWKEEKKRLFEETSPYKCGHCGNGNVRYVVATEHIPTGERVCFGDICVGRLGFEDYDAFTASRIRDLGKARDRAEKLARQKQTFIEENTELKWAIERINDDAHKRNHFAHDIVQKFDRYGELSSKQMEWLIKSMKRDIDYAERKAKEDTEPKGDAPDGRQTVIGKVLSVKWYESGFGDVCKMLVKLENNAKVFTSVPELDYKTDFGLKVGGSALNRGDKIEVTATFSRKDDPHFAYGKRPRVTILERYSQ